MDDLEMRIAVFILGGCFGFVFGYIVRSLREIKEEVDEIATIERKKDESGVLQRKWAFNIAFVIAILIIFYSAYATRQNTMALKEQQQRNFVSVCQAGTEIRDVQRLTVDAIYNLFTALIAPEIERSGGVKNLKPGEVEEINAFIDNANRFRESSYRQIQPTVKCEPFVSDVNVEPPTEPYPRIGR